MFRYIQVRTSSGALYTFRDHTSGGGCLYASSRRSSIEDITNEVIAPFIIEMGKRMYFLPRRGGFRDTSTVESIFVMTYLTKMRITSFVSSIFAGEAV